VALFDFTLFAERVQENGHLTTPCCGGRAVFLIGSGRKRGGKKTRREGDKKIGKQDSV
jgi:hypothetical protein